MCETCKIEDVLYKNNITVYDKDNNEIELKLELMVCPMCKKLIIAYGKFYDTKPINRKFT